MKHELSIVRGATSSFGISVTDANGDPFVLESGDVLVFGLKKKLKDIDRILIKPITHNMDGEYYLELSAADTEDLEPGKYFYDVGLQRGTNVFYNIIEASVFNIKANVTKRGDAR